MAAGDEVVSVSSGAARPNTICSLEVDSAVARTPTVVPFHVDRVFTADGASHKAPTRCHCLRDQSMATSVVKV